MKQVQEYVVISHIFERSSWVSCILFADVCFVIWNILREARRIKNTHVCNNMNHITVLQFNPVCFPQNWETFHSMYFHWICQIIMALFSWGTCT